LLSFQENNKTLADFNEFNLLRHLANEFFLDCRQRLDSESFKKLLFCLTEFNISRNSSSNEKINLTDTKSFIQSEEFSILDKIYQIIKSDENLCKKFSAFLVDEYSSYFNLLMQTCQYEKCFDFFHKLQVFKFELLLN
jgi:hypothetical protein